jgi:hypothetical protein
VRSTTPVSLPVTPTTPGSSTAPGSSTTTTTTPGSAG